MPSLKKNTIAARLNAAQLAITNSLADAEIKAAVEQFGYIPAKFTEGQTLYQNALTAVNANKSGRGDQKTATTDLKAKEKAARDAYQAAAQVARATLDKDRLTTLGLNGKEPRTTANFIHTAYTLFDNAASSGLLAEFGYDKARITAERAKVEAFDQANQIQEAAKGSSQQAAQEQQAALDKMNDWLAQYLKIAKVALRDKKQLLEKIGIGARTVKTAAQRAAPAKASATRAAKKVK